MELPPVMQGAMTPVVRFAIVLLLLASRNAHAQSAWVPTDLGTLGGDTALANGINDAGQVVGNSNTRAGRIHPRIRLDGLQRDGRPRNVGRRSASTAFGISANGAGCRLYGGVDRRPFRDPLDGSRR